MMASLVRRLYGKFLRCRLMWRIRLLARPNLETWYYDCLVRQATKARDWSPSSRTYYEFGVAGGNTMLAYIWALQKFCADHGRDIRDHWIVGFDTFEGLPPKRSEQDDHVSWRAGGMKHPSSEVRERVERSGFPLENLRLVQGRFEDILTHELRTELVRSPGPPAIVTMDCDYYSSTKTVLDWLAPVLVSGTFFYFDDIWAFHGNPNYGELLAIAEFNRSGMGFLTPYPFFGLDSYAYLYARHPFEFRESAGRDELVARGGE